MDAVLAPWLRRQVGLDRSLGGLVQTGIAVITQAGFFANLGRRIAAGPDSERFVPAWIARAGLGFRPPPTSRSSRLWFPDEAALVWGERFDTIFVGLARRAGVGKEHLERSPARFPRLLFRGMVGTAPDALKGYQQPLTRIEAAKALCCVLGGETVDGQTDRAHRLTPFELLTTAYRSLQRRAETERFCRDDVYALMLLGLAADALLEMHSCSLCFRWAMPPHTLCIEHGLSKTLPGSRLERQARYAAGCRVAAAYRHSGGGIPDNLNSFELDTRAFVVARCLWRSSLPDEQRTLSALLRQLEQLPHVREEVGMTGAGADDRPRPGQLIELLRSRLDPLEFHPGAWRDKLAVAERWFAAKKTATPGSRGRGNRTAHRVMTALLSFDPKRPASQADLACRAGVSPSALSHWKRNRADEPITQELAQRIKKEKEPLQAERRRLRRVLARWPQPTKDS